MQLFGSYAIRDGKLHPLYQQQVSKPYYFIDRKFHNFTGKEHFSLAPTDIHKPYLLNAIIPTKEDDGLLMWFQAAPNHRYKICRSLTTGAVVFQIGENGSLAIAICAKNVPAKLVFLDKQGGTIVSYALQNGQVTSNTGPAPAGYTATQERK